MLASPGAALAAPEVSQLWLVDATTNQRLRSLENNDTIALPISPNELSIEAEANDETGSVVMRIDNVISSTENLAPYSLVGDESGDFLPAPRLRTPGSVIISARPYASDDASGAAGEPLTLRLQVYQPDFFVTDKRDLHDLNPGDGRCHAHGFVFLPDLPDLGATPLPPRYPQSSFCTLRAAIEESNALAGQQSVLVDGRKGPFVLTQGELKITEGMTINGHEMPVIDGRMLSRVLNIDGEGDDIIVNLRQLELTRGDPGTAERGGAILIVNEALAQISGCVIRDSRANFGGGIYLQAGGDLTMWDTAVRDNEAGHPASFGGGGITQRGGGIFNLGGNVKIVRSSIFDNAAVRGGGVSNFGGRMSIENSSVIDNEAASLGGGIENSDNFGERGILHLAFTTVAFNHAGTSYGDPDSERRGGGLFNAGRVFMASSILAENGDPFSASNPNHAPDCYSATQYDFASYRNNVVGVLNGNCKLTDYSAGNATGFSYGTASAPLDPAFTSRTFWDGLAYYNLYPSSVALDRGAPQSASFYPCPAQDMRSRARPVGAGCDVGAVERQ